LLKLRKWLHHLDSTYLICIRRSHISGKLHLILLILMLFLVLLQTWLSVALETTSWIIASIWFLSSVRLHVSFHVEFYFKRSTAFLTFEWFFYLEKD
jgi:hypothetical protein